MFIILNGTKEEHLDMLDGGIIQRLLEEKWKTFARNQFLKRLLILFIHLLFLSISVYLRPVRTDLASEDADPNDPDENGGIEQSADAQNIIRYCAELGTIAGVLSYVIFQQGDEVKNQGLSAFLKQLVSDLSIVKNIFTLLNSIPVTCSSESNIPILELIDLGMHTISYNGRHRYRGSYISICCTWKLVFTNVFCRVSFEKKNNFMYCCKCLCF